RREGIVGDVDGGKGGRGEERGLPHVRFSHDPQLHGVKNGLLAQEPWREVAVPPWPPVRSPRWIRGGPPRIYRRPRAFAAGHPGVRGIGAGRHPVRWVFRPEHWEDG